jgi:hypothetical protein
MDDLKAAKRLARTLYILAKGHDIWKERPGLSDRNLYEYVEEQIDKRIEEIKSNGKES